MPPVTASIIIGRNNDAGETMQDTSREDVSRNAPGAAWAHGAPQARRKLLIWTAVIAFILGTALCGFGPKNSSNDVATSVEEKKTMAVLNNSAVTAEVARPVQETIPAGMETATFAMG